MKRKIFLFILGFGWLFFGVFLSSRYLYNRFSIDTTNSNFQPIVWKEHIDLFKGVLQCSLTSKDEFEHKKILKEKVFSKASYKESKKNGFTYFFNYDAILLKDVLEFVLKEKECCSFFKFDISILPYDHGMALQISG